MCKPRVASAHEQASEKGKPPSLPVSLWPACAEDCAHLTKNNWSGSGREAVEAGGQLAGGGERVARQTACAA